MEIEWLDHVGAAEYLRGDLQRLTEARPMARAGILSDTSVSVGVAVRVAPDLEARCRRRGWPILRRVTGGTGLLHLPGDLLWSVVLPARDARVGRGFVRAYGRYGEPIRRALHDCGVPASWSPALGLSERFCLLGARGEVLTVGGSALGGAAQHLTQHGLLHHGVVGARVDRPALSELFEVSPDTLRDRLTAFGECAGTGSLAEVGRRALAHWAAEPD